MPSESIWEIGIEQIGSEFRILDAGSEKCCELAEFKGAALNDSRRSVNLWIILDILFVR